MTNAERAKKLAERITAQVARGAGKGLDAARVFFAARVKETLSVPAPRKAIRGATSGKKKGPILGYRATTRAMPGAPPRKLSGRLRTSITSRMVTPMKAVVSTNVKYARPLELSRRHPHKFFATTAAKYQRELKTIIGRNVVVSIKAGAR